MGVLAELQDRYQQSSDPFLIANGEALYFDDMRKADDVDLSSVAAGFGISVFVIGSSHG